MTAPEASVRMPPLLTPQPPRNRPGPPESVLIECWVVSTGVSRSWPSTGCTASPVPNTGEVAEDPSFVDRPPQPPAIQSYHMKQGLGFTRESWPPTSRYSRLNAQVSARSGMMWDHSWKIAFITFSYGP